MKRHVFLFFFSSLIAIYRLAATEAHLDEKQELSFYRGYLLWQDHLKRPRMSYDLEQVIAGMRAAENGGKPPFDEGQLQAKIIEFQNNVLAKQTEENLADAESLLAKIAQEDSFEIVPNKLYFKRLKQGGGREVQNNSTPVLTYILSTYDRSGESEVISRDLPFPITLKDTIPGFAQGVAGMLEGEIRQLFIHPDLAYGTYGKLDPNLLVILKVEVISADDEANRYK